MVEIYMGVIGGLWGLVNFLFWSKIKRIENDIEENKKKSDAIVHNYLDRFQKLNDKLGDVEKNIIREIYAKREK